MDYNGIQLKIVAIGPCLGAPAQQSSSSPNQSLKPNVRFRASWIDWATLKHWF